MKLNGIDLKQVERAAIHLLRVLEEEENSKNPNLVSQGRVRAAFDIFSTAVTRFSKVAEFADQKKLGWMLESVYTETKGFINLGLDERWRRMVSSLVEQGMTMPQLFKEMASTNLKKFTFPRRDNRPPLVFTSTEAGLSDAVHQVFPSGIVEGYSFKNLDLNGVDFSGMTLLNCDFLDATLINTKFEGAKLKGCTFIKSDLYNANFSKASFENSDILSCNVGRAKFTDATSVGDSGLTARGNTYDDRTCLSPGVKSLTSDWHSVTVADKITKSVGKHVRTFTNVGLLASLTAAGITTDLPLALGAVAFGVGWVAGGKAETMINELFKDTDLGDRVRGLVAGVTSGIEGTILQRIVARARTAMVLEDGGLPGSVGRFFTMGNVVVCPEEAVKHINKAIHGEFPDKDLTIVRFGEQSESLFGGFAVDDDADIIQIKSNGKVVAHYLDDKGRLSQTVCYAADGTPERCDVFREDGHTLTVAATANQGYVLLHREAEGKVTKKEVGRALLSRELLMHMVRDKLFYDAGIVRQSDLSNDDAPAAAMAV